MNLHYPRRSSILWGTPIKTNNTALPKIQDHLVFRKLLHFPCVLPVHWWDLQMLLAIQLQFGFRTTENKLVLCFEEIMVCRMGYSKAAVTFLWANETTSKRPRSCKEWLLYLPVLHRNLCRPLLFLDNEEESYNAGGRKAAGPQSTNSDMDKQQMRAATGGEDKRAFLSTTVASAKSQPAGLLHWTFLLSHQKARASSLLCTRACMHETVPKASLISEPLLLPVFSHCFSSGPEVPEGGLKLWEEWEKLWLRKFSSSLSPSMQRCMCRLLSLQ